MPGRPVAATSPSTISTSGRPEATELIHRRPDVVFHLAAQIDVRVSVDQPSSTPRSTCSGTLRILEGARRAGIARVVFAASGGTLYGEPDPSDLPVTESHPHRPLSPYGVSKKAAIDYLVAYRELHSVEFCALALANVYGPRQDPHGEAGVVAIFADRLLAAQRVTIYGDGEQTRDYVYVDDVVDAFARAATRGGGLVRNIGTGRETSVIELYRPMAQRAGVEPQFTTGRPAQGNCGGTASTRAGPPSTWAGVRGPSWLTGWRRSSKLPAVDGPDQLSLHCLPRDG